MKRLLLLGLLFLFFNQITAQGWGEIQKIVPDDRAIGDEFGYSVAMQGEYAIISARDKATTSTSNGAVYVFKKGITGDWNQEQRLTQTNINQFDQFGDSVAIDGDYLIVGCRGQDYDENDNNYINDAPGAAYIFEKDGSGNWIQAQKLVGTVRTSLDVFGDSVAISGDYAIVSAPWEDEDENDLNTLQFAGSAFIFERDSGGVWQRVQKIVASDREANMEFGDKSVAINGNYIAVGCWREAEDEVGGNTLAAAGAVYMFERDGSGVWSEVQKIVASNRQGSELFGKDVAISGDFLIVGAEQGNVDGGYSGSAYIFERDGSGSWNEVQEIIASDAESLDRFGKSVSIEGDFAIIGSYEENTNGSAYVFERNTSGVWNQAQKLVASDAAMSDYFGFDVAISQGFSVVGAHQEDEDEIGMNTLGFAGSAYIFDSNEPTLSIIKSDYDNIVKAYPNPIENVLNLDLGNYYNKVEVKVLNIIGQKVFSKNYRNAKTIQLELNQPKGVYLVEVKIGEQIPSVLKILKH